MSKFTSIKFEFLIYLKIVIILFQKDLVTDMAQKSDERLYDQFSGLGVPTSFQKKLYENKNGFDQLEKLEENYRQLCRGDNIQVNMM